MFLDGGGLDAAAHVAGLPLSGSCRFCLPHVANFPIMLRIGHAQTVDNLRFFLPPDLPAPSIPLQITVLGRDGRLEPNVEIVPEDDMWETSASDGRLTKRTDSEGKATLLLRKGAYYNVMAVVSLPGGRQECAGPVGVLAEEGLKPVTLIVSHSIGNCFLFKKRRD